MPKISGLKLIKFLKKKGFKIYNRKGSHVKMISTEKNTKTIIPMHKEISIGTIKSIFKQSK